MSDQFEKDILSNVNSFRINPQSIQHQIEVLHRGIGRFKPNDPFLLEIEAFLKTLPTIQKMNPVVINKDLCNIASSEVKKYAKDEKNYNPYRIGKELEGIVPENYIAEYPALIADNGADEAETIVPKLLLNRLDEAKKGRKFSPRHCLKLMVKLLYPLDKRTMLIIINIMKANILLRKDHLLLCNIKGMDKLEVLNKALVSPIFMKTRQL